MLAPQVQPPPHRVAGFALAALALGAVGFIVAAVAQDHIFAEPALALALPPFALTALAALASVIRRERAPALWLAGLGLAAAALVLGWFLVVAIVVAVACGLILVLHALF